MANVQIVLEGVDNATGVLRGVGGAIGGLGDVIKTGLGVALGNVLTPAFEAARDAMGSFITSALENEKILARLDTVIRSTGGAAGLTVEAAQDLATQFMNLAGGSDDAVLAIQEMALRMGTISAQQMPDFIQTTLDLAAATGQDAVAAARLLAQAQEDPISALTRFRRMGILFTEDLEKQIKTLQESGDTAGAMALVMQRLGEATGGAAAAAADTLSGKWEVLKGRLGEAGEAIGMSVLPLFTKLFDDVIAPALPFVEDMAAAFGAFVEVLSAGDLQAAIEVFGEFESFQAIFKALGVDIYGVASAVQGFVEGVMAQGPLVFAALQPIIDAAFNVAAAFTESMPMIQAKVQEMAAFVLAQVQMMSPTLIANVSEMLNQIATFWRNHGDTIMAVVGVAWQFIVVTIGGTLTLVSGLIASALALINGDWESAWQSIVTTLETFMNMALSIVGTNLEEFTESWRGTFELAQIIWNTFWTNFLTTWNGNWQLAKTIVTTVWDQIVAAVRATIAQFIDIGRGIIDGIISGIQSAVGRLVQTAINAALAALAGAKAALGINSPSTVFAGIGANMMQGMAQGITANAGLPAEAVRAVSSSTVHNSGGNTYNYYGVQGDMDMAYRAARAGAT